MIWFGAAIYFSICVGISGDCVLMLSAIGVGYQMLEAVLDPFYRPAQLE